MSDDSSPSSPSPTKRMERTKSVAFILKKAPLVKKSSSILDSLWSWAAHRGEKKTVIEFTIHVKKISLSKNDAFITRSNLAIVRDKKKVKHLCALKHNLIDVEECKDLTFDDNMVFEASLFQRVLPSGDVDENFIMKDEKFWIRQLTLMGVDEAFDDVVFRDLASFTLNLGQMLNQENCEQARGEWTDVMTLELNDDDRHVEGFIELAIQHTKLDNSKIMRRVSKVMEKSPPSSPKSAATPPTVVQ